MRRPRAWAIGLLAAISLAFLASLSVLAGRAAGWLWALGIGLAALVGILLFTGRRTLPEAPGDAARRPNDQLGTSGAWPASRPARPERDGLRRGELEDLDDVRHA